MNQHSLTRKKYHLPMIGAALAAASLFSFSLPVFAAGTEAGEKIRNTATGEYKDDVGNTYKIDSNTVEITVAKVAGITNMPTGINDKNGGSVLTGDMMSFEFTITNVGNDISNIYIPGTAANIDTKGLDETTMVVEVSEIDPTATPTFKLYADFADGIVKDVPINSKFIVRVTAKVTATAAGAPIEVRLGDTGSNTDPNSPVADTQNQFDDTENQPGDAAKAANEVRTLEASNPTAGIVALPDKEQKEASAVAQVSLGSNPMAMTKIEKTRVYDTALPANTDEPLNNNIVTYNLGLEVLTTTPNPLYTPGKLEGRDLTNRLTSTTVTDKTNLVLVSDAIPAGTHLSANLATSFTEGGRTWTAVYTTDDATVATGSIKWVTTPPALDKVTRIGWVYDANSTTKTINPGAIVSGFTFNVITDGLTAGGTVANIAQVFGSTDDGNPATNKGPVVFDESGDQDPSNFNGPNPGPLETATSSTGIANPSSHGVDTNNNNSATNNPGGEDNVITIAEPGKLINGPVGQPSATGDIYVASANNNHDFQNKGIGNFDEAKCTTDTASGNPQTEEGCTLDPEAVVFNNTLKNPAISDPTDPKAGELKDVLLQPINPGFDGFGGTDANLPEGTKVTIKLGTQQAIYTYTKTGSVYSFVLDGDGTTSETASKAIKIPTLSAGVSLDYKVTIDLPLGTKLSTDVGHGYAVPIIAFIDKDNNGTPDTGENSNYTVNQVYTDFVKINKKVEIYEPDGKTARTGDPLPGDILKYIVEYRNISEPQAGNGGNVVLNGIDVMIDENGTQAGIADMTEAGNNWGIDNNKDGDLDTINIQGTAEDSNSNSTITYYTGQSPSSAPSKYSVDSLTSAGTTDPGETVTGYRSTIPLLAPATSDTDNSTFTFERKVDQFDGLAEENLK